MKINREELAWAAGFFDGEGSTTVQRRDKERKSDRPVMSIQQTGTGEELFRFLKAVDDGKIYGPYKRKNPKHKPFYQYMLIGFNRVLPVIEKLWPFLCSDKREQAMSTLINTDTKGIMNENPFPGY